MKLSPFLHHLHTFFQHTGPDPIMVIKTQMPSIGPLAVVPVKHVWVGFDWDAGKIIIEPETPLFTRTSDEEVQKLRQQLDELCLENIALKRQLREHTK